MWDSEWMNQWNGIQEIFGGQPITSTMHIKCNEVGVECVLKFWVIIKISFTFSVWVGPAPLCNQHPHTPH